MVIWQVNVTLRWAVLEQCTFKANLNVLYSERLPTRNLHHPTKLLQRAPKVNI